MKRRRSKYSAQIRPFLAPFLPPRPSIQFVAERVVFYDAIVARERGTAVVDAEKRCTKGSVDLASYGFSDGRVGSVWGAKTTRAACT